MNNLERRSRPVELRAEGRQLSGVVMPYGERSEMPWGGERFLPGVFQPLGDVKLNLLHQRVVPIARTGAGLELIDGPDALRMTAALPDVTAAKDAVELVRAGVLQGLSVEFTAVRERLENGDRVIERAVLSGIGVVDDGAYPGATVEARGRRGMTLRSRIPSGRRVSCMCSGAGTKWARIIGPAMKRAIDTAFRDASRVIAARNNYGSPLASVNKRNMRGRVLDDGDAEVEIDLPTGPDGDAVIRAAEDSGIVVRPVLQDLDEAPTFEARATPDRTRVYSNFEIRAFIVSTTDAAAGWPVPELIPTPDMAQPQPRRRLIWQ